MNTHQMNDHQTGTEDTILEEAIAWESRLRATDLRPDDPYRNRSVRNRAFFEWLKRSAAHLRVFMEVAALARHARRLDPDVFADIRELAESEYLDEDTLAPPQVPAPPAPAVLPLKSRPQRQRVATGIAMAAACAIVGFVALFVLFSHSKPELYTTPIGDREVRKLSDGSVIKLSPDSQLEVRFSRKARETHLIRGEVYFKVTHNPERPFTVTSDDAAVRVVGTEFDVHKQRHATQVAVVSGRVQTAAVSRETPQQPVVLSGGEMATISSGKVTKIPDGNVQEALAWQKNQLVFHHARLADVVEEFNRYNRPQIRVEGAAAQDFRLSGTFDTNGYLDIIAFANAQNSLLVVPDGPNWIIRSRQ